MLYPEHIYDPLRIELAEQLLEKELAKLFPGVLPVDLATQVTRWRTDPQPFHLEDGIRDFWDIFAAVFESIKLKPAFTSLLTAENYTLSQAALTTRDIQLSSHLAQLQRLELNWSDDYSVGNALDAMSDSEKDTQKQLNDDHSTLGQDSYPIIVRQTPGANTYKVMDGNRRALRAGLYDKMAIDAWVIKSSDSLPKNFWVPVNDLMQIGKLYRLAVTDLQKTAVRNSLELLFQQSDIAKITYRTRLMKQSNPWADRLYHHKPTI